MRTSPGWTMATVTARSQRRWVVVLVGLALVVSACGSAGDDVDDAAADEGEHDTAGAYDEGWESEEPDGAPQSDSDDSAGQDTDPIATSAATGRRVIRTAQLVLEVDEPAEAAQEVFAIAERRGGFVAETDLERDADGDVRGSITLRVPSAQLVDAVEELDRLATAVPVRRLDETDVTSEVADLDAQVRNLTTYERELTELLADVRTTTDRPDDLLVVFERVRSVREEIDRLEARVAVLADQVALSTISVTLRPSPTEVTIAATGWSPGEQTRNALAATSRALTGIADVTIWIVLTALPIALVLGSPVALGALLWRRRTAASRSA